MDRRAAVVCLSLLVSSVSCVETKAVSCTDDRVCPAGYACDEVHQGCVFPEQLTACAAAIDLTPCSYRDVSDGVCSDGVCFPAGCGNGLVEEGEACDDGNQIFDDGCSADCMSNETCGNGYVDTVKGEGCDDGNTVGGDQCQPNCASPTCGDGSVDPQYNEACDLGPANSDDADALCRTNCQLQRCGDGIVDTGEACDDGNLASLDGCSYDCRSTETCGNGETDFVKGELCDDGNSLSGDGCGVCMPEEARWSQYVVPQPPGARRYSAMTYDAGRRRVVMFGGQGMPGNSINGQTWEWDGSTWLNVSPAMDDPPPVRRSSALAYDAARGHVVMFGGYSTGIVPAGTLADTWGWNGKVWTNLTPATGSPPPRERHGLAYDAARQRLVLFGGVHYGTSSTTRYNDTWEWDGSAWQNVTPASGSPSPRDGASLSYDPVRARIVLVGGETAASTVSNETWEWNGTTWTNRSPATGNLPGRRNHAASWDPIRQRTVVFGGDASGPLGDTWAWDGGAGTWTNVSPSIGPAARYGHATSFDLARGELVLFGGNDLFNGDLADTHAWNGTSWRVVTLPTALPTSRSLQADAYDSARGRVIVFGGEYEGGGQLVTLGDTWAWTGSTWLAVTSAGGSPSPRTSSALAFDARRDRLVLFGGGGLGDTWELDDSGWHDVSPAAGSPPARSRHRLAYDVSRERVVLFGGDLQDGTISSDTWEWDGTTWTNVTPAAGNPSPRMNHALTYDPVRRRVVLSGGITAGGARLDDLWEWDGTAWSSITQPSTRPAPRHSHGLTYDTARARLVLHGGWGASTYLGDLWEWDGAAWTLRPLSSRPTARYSPTLAYDQVRKELVLFGGYRDTFPFAGDDTWRLRFDNAAPLETCGSGIDGDRDGVIGCTDDDCFGACTPSCNPAVMSCGTSGPRCGDGVCQPVEQGRLCPADCPQVARCGDYFCDTPESSTTCPGDCP